MAIPAGLGKCRARMPIVKEFWQRLGEKPIKGGETDWPARQIHCIARRETRVTGCYRSRAVTSDPSERTGGRSINPILLSYLAARRVRGSSNLDVVLSPAKSAASCIFNQNIAEVPVNLDNLSAITPSTRVFRQRTPFRTVKDSPITSAAARTSKPRAGRTHSLRYWPGTTGWIPSSAGNRRGLCGDIPIAHNLIIAVCHTLVTADLIISSW